MVIYHNFELTTTTQWHMIDGGNQFPILTNNAHKLEVSTFMATSSNAPLLTNSLF
jgi:hypothetical protein